MASHFWAVVLVLADSADLVYSQECAASTGGSCTVLGCHGWRNATCDGSQCVCDPPRTCSVNGECVAPDDCPKYTNGTCELSGCHTRRNAFCQSALSEIPPAAYCVCGPNQCAADGVCAAKCHIHTGTPCYFSCGSYSQCVGGLGSSQCRCNPGSCVVDGGCLPIKALESSVSPGEPLRSSWPGLEHLFPLVALSLVLVACGTWCRWQCKYPKKKRRRNGRVAVPYMRPLEQQMLRENLLGEINQDDDHDMELHVGSIDLETFFRSVVEEITRGGWINVAVAPIFFPMAYYTQAYGNNAWIVLVVCYGLRFAIGVVAQIATVSRFWHWVQRQSASWDEERHALFQKLYKPLKISCCGKTLTLWPQWFKKAAVHGLDWLDTDMDWATAGQAWAMSWNSSMLSTYSRMYNSVPVLGVIFQTVSLEGCLSFIIIASALVQTRDFLQYVKFLRTRIPLWQDAAPVQESHNGGIEAAQSIQSRFWVWRGFTHLSDNGNMGLTAEHFEVLQEVEEERFVRLGLTNDIVNQEKLFVRANRGAKFRTKILCEALPQMYCQVDLFRCAFETKTQSSLCFLAFSIVASIVTVCLAIPGYPCVLVGHWYAGNMYDVRLHVTTLTLAIVLMMVLITHLAGTAICDGGDAVVIFHQGCVGVNDEVYATFPVQCVMWGSLTSLVMYTIISSVLITEIQKAVRSGWARCCKRPPQSNNLLVSGYTNVAPEAVLEKTGEDVTKVEEGCLHPTAKAD